MENSSVSRKYSPSTTTNELDLAITAVKSNPVEKTTNVLRPMLSLESAVRFGLVGNYMNTSVIILNQHITILLNT